MKMTWMLASAILKRNPKRAGATGAGAQQSAYEQL